jgi:predicted RNase H-like HicB family nuclease
MAKKSLKKKVYQFTAIFEKNEDGGYTVTVPSLPGCISEGDTFDEALKNIKEAIALYLEVMKKDKEKEFLKLLKDLK